MIRDLRSLGCYIKYIAHKLNACSKTVGHTLERQGPPPQRKSGIRVSKPEPYKARVDQILSDDDDVWNTVPYIGFLQYTIISKMKTVTITIIPMKLISIIDLSKLLHSSYYFSGNHLDYLSIQIRDLQMSTVLHTVIMQYSSTICRDHEGQGILTPNYHPKTIYFLTVWEYWLGIAQPKNVFRSILNSSIKQL